MTQYRYGFTFSLKEADMVDYNKAREKFKLIDLVKLGIKEGLKQIEKGDKK